MISTSMITTFVVLSERILEMLDSTVKSSSSFWSKFYWFISSSSIYRSSAALVGLLLDGLFGSLDCNYCIETTGACTLRKSEGALLCSLFIGTIFSWREGTTLLSDGEWLLACWLRPSTAAPKLSPLLCCIESTLTLKRVLTLRMMLDFLYLLSMIDGRIASLFGVTDLLRASSMALKPGVS